jgi:hypothetical protein
MNLQEGTRQAKARKAFLIWLMQPEAWKGNKELEEENKEEEEEGHRRRRGKRRRRRKGGGGSTGFSVTTFRGRNSEQRRQSTEHRPCKFVTKLCFEMSSKGSRWITYCLFMCFYFWMRWNLSDWGKLSASFAKSRTCEAPFRMVGNLTSDAR